MQSIKTWQSAAADHEPGWLAKALCFGMMALACAAGLQAMAYGAEPTRVGGKPNLNGIWQAMGTANWNLEAHSASKIPSLWPTGALFSIPAGKSYVAGGKIPYKPEALKQRDQYRAEWPKSDPETFCYLPGLPRAMYMPYPFQIIQSGTRDILMVYSYATSNRMIFMGTPKEPPVDSWMGRSQGRWDGDTLVVTTTGFNGRAHLDRAGNHFSAAMKLTERFRLENPNVIRYEATIEDPATFTSPWTLRMPLYKNVEAEAELLEYKCIPFAEELLYKDLERPASR